MVQLQFQSCIFKDIAPSKKGLEEFSKTPLTTEISKKTEEISLVEAVISKESSYKTDNIQYHPEEACLKVAKVNVAEVPSEKKPVVKTQKQKETGLSRGMCDLESCLFRICLNSQYDRLLSMKNCTENLVININDESKILSY